MTIDRSKLGEVRGYILAEADFNRSWADGRRGVGMPGANNDGYKARRIEIAVEREVWAASIGDAIAENDRLRAALKRALELAMSASECAPATVLHAIEIISQEAGL